MEYCFKCGKELDCGLSHIFCGYGYCIRFCALCCPRTYDESYCEYEHEDAPTEQ